MTDGNGLIREESLTAIPLMLEIAAQPLTDEMEQRPLRIKRGEEHSTVRPETESAGHLYHYVTIGELIDRMPNIEGWEEEKLPAYHFPERSIAGISIEEMDSRHIIEVCPFRAWSLLLHHQRDYSLINAYNQGLMAVLVYADLLKTGDDENKKGIGSISHFFTTQLLDLSHIPNRIEDNQFEPIVYDVPFKDRYTHVEFIDTEDNLDTQMFYVANKTELIISWRGTASGTDVLTDLKFKPRWLSENDFVSKGKVHSVFWNAFMEVNHKTALFDVDNDKQEMPVLNGIKELALGKKLFICGHSLGGTLAFLHSSQLRYYNPCLYTYGMPRVFTYSAIEEIGNFIHYRHVNKNDPVPRLPFEKDMDNYSFKLGLDNLGYSSEIKSTIMPSELDSLYKTKSEELYLHHGRVIHFHDMHHIEPASANKINFIAVGNLKRDIFNFYSAPHLLPYNESSLYYYPDNAQPRNAHGITPLAHLSGNHIQRIKNKIIELCIPKQNRIHKEHMNDFKKKKDGDNMRIGKHSLSYPYFIKLEKELEKCLFSNKKSEVEQRAINIYTHHVKIK
ncbi:lipase family protein [Xenorhabdus sp. DI]|uniref:lipase family protein n=1 Tax=Xenorhabdus doucetiae TaxID=351671 RepID=UPI0019C5E3E8|nr:MULTISPECIES: lipase family protein [unclassified Xenorhabdus]MBD2785206.1 lipase family protein [Xenorhabdus sp. 3]MBD2787625.1 lipase family protein [Xenorhabdus sp. DI]